MVGGVWISLIGCLGCMLDVVVKFVGILYLFCVVLWEFYGSVLLVRVSVLIYVICYVDVVSLDDVFFLYIKFV